MLMCVVCIESLKIVNSYSGEIAVSSFSEVIWKYYI